MKFRRLEKKILTSQTPENAFKDFIMCEKKISCIECEKRPQCKHRSFAARYSTQDWGIPHPLTNRFIKYYYLTELFDSQHGSYDPVTRCYMPHYKYMSLCNRHDRDMREKYLHGISSKDLKPLYDIYKNYRLDQLKRLYDAIDI